MNIEAKVEDLSQKHGWSKREVSARVSQIVGRKIDPSHFNKMLTGESTLSLEVCRAIGQVFCVPMDFLLDPDQTEIAIPSGAITPDESRLLNIIRSIGVEMAESRLLAVGLERMISQVLMPDRNEVINRDNGGGSQSNGPDKAVEDD